MAPLYEVLVKHTKKRYYGFSQLCQTGFKSIEMIQGALQQVAVHGPDIIVSGCSDAFVKVIDIRLFYDDTHFQCFNF